jgi:hypothetical protein
MDEIDLAASIAIRNKGIIWEEDKKVTACRKCKKLFGFLLRKHHCRHCGCIFCDTCSNYYVVIPDFITDRVEPEDYWNISYYITPLRSKEERVCKQCYEVIKGKTSAYETIMSIFTNPVAIDKIKQLSDSNSDVKNHYFDHLRNIQYYLPNHRYSDIDKKLLRINAHFFSKHSKYMVHLIKSMDWSISSSLMSKSFRNSSLNISTIANASNEQLQFVISIINGEKNKRCSDLYCTRTCQEELSCDDCINILYSCANNLPDQLLKYFFGIIMNTPKQVILCHLTFFVSLVKNNSTNKLLQTLLFEILNQTKKIRYHTFWFLNNAKENANEREMRNIKSFIELFDMDEIRIMHREYMFYVGLIDNLDDPVKYLTNEFDKYKPISLPYEPDFKIVNVDLNGISVKSSYTKPVIIPFEIKEFNDEDTAEESETEKINLLFKKESIMNDVTVLNLMTLCDIILNENLNTNFGVVVYPTMPLTANSGMIQIVDQAETIYAIASKKKTILQHIIERNEDKVISHVLDKYMYSLVSYTLHSYFIGLGDRHLQNIMITDDGAIFHIDFGFILGTDAYPLTASDIKLNSDMLDVIGGTDSARYITYLDMCCKGVILLRKYFNMFFILLSQDSKFKEREIEKFVKSRFQPRQADYIVIEELMTVIKHSNNAYSDLIRDFLHYHTQEKTVQNGIGWAIGVAFGAVKSFSNSH